MMNTRFVIDESTHADCEKDSELTDTHHVSILDEGINEHVNEVFTSYFMADGSSERSLEHNVNKWDSATYPASSVLILTLCEVIQEIVTYLSLMLRKS